MISFKKHLGHQSVVRLLQNQVAKKNLRGAYIFIGPPNVGKFDLAKYFATIIHEPKFSEKIRQAIDVNLHPNTLILGPRASKKTARKTISIGEIHQLTRQINLTPHSSQYQVGIIYDAEYLTNDASNAFLKTLEEPPEKVILILTSSKENFILPTILSRCQKYYIKLVKKDLIVSNLIRAGVEKTKAQKIANLSAGKPGLAIKLVEGGLDEYHESVKLLEQLIIGCEAERLNQAKEIAERKNIIEILDKWLVYFRDMMLSKSNLDDEIINIDRLVKIKKLGRQFSRRKIYQSIQNIKIGQDMLAGNANPRLVLENLAIEV